MVVRSFLLTLLLLSPVCAVQRPETKATLRQLTRLPRIESNFSFDFSAARGFPVLNVAPDPVIAIGRKRSELAGKGNDSQLLLELAGLHMETGEFGTAHTFFRRAEEAFRRRLESAANNTELKIGLASALHGLGRQAEAESILREAVLETADSKRWIALASFLEARSWELLAGASNWNGRRSYAELCRSALRRTNPSEVFARAERLIEEAIEAARKAAGSPGDEENKAHASARAAHRLAICIASRDCIQRLRDRIEGDDPMSAAEMWIYSSGALEPLARAADADSRNPQRIATLALWRALASAAEQHLTMREFTRAEGPHPVPENILGPVDDAIGRLAGLSDKGDGAAAQAHGTLLYALRRDYHGAAEAFQRALARIPESEQVWETLTLALLGAENYLEMAAVSEARALERPTVRNRLLVARAFEKLGNFARAEDEVRLALSINATDFSANIAMANLLMRNSTGDVPGRVRQSIANAERSIPMSARGSQWVDLALTQSIFHGLDGNPDRARQILKAALQVAKDDPAVAAALDAIGH